MNSKKTNKIRKILWAILPGMIVAGLVFGANTYYDLDLPKVIVEEAQKIIGQLETTATTTLATLSGNVGIGTPSPALKLDVSGSARIWDQTATTGVSTLTIRAGEGQATAPLFEWLNNAGTALGRISGEGRFGIGTTTTNAMLTIKSDGAATPALLLEGAVSPSADYLQIRTAGASAGDILTVDSSGRVGIGTTAPDRKLDILDASNPQLRLTQADGTVYSEFQTASTGTLTITTSATAGTDDIVFSPAGAERFRILENGDLFFEKGTSDVTLAVTAPSASRTYTIPDFGADDSFVGVSATQTLTNKTISTGSTYQGNVIATTYGGTGLSNYTAGDILYYSSGTALSKLGIGSANQVLTSSGTAPQWSTNIAVSALPTGGNWDITSDLTIETPTLFIGHDGGSYAGNVGIGTTSPQQKLTISSGSNFATEMATPGAPTLTCNTSGGTLADGTYYYTIVASDGVGYTTGGPSSSCTISGGGGAGSVSISWSAITGASSYRVYGRDTGYGQYWTSSTTSYTDTGTAGTAGTPPTVTTAYVNKLTASGNSWLLGGNVGIGTTEPGYKLEVSGGRSKLGGGLLSPYTRIVIVDAEGKGDYTSVVEAIAAVSPTSTNPVLIKVGPGTFNESSPITSKDYLTIKGAGIGKTIITVSTDNVITVTAGHSDFQMEDLTLALGGNPGQAYIINDGRYYRIKLASSSWGNTLSGSFYDSEINTQVNTGDGTFHNCTINTFYSGTCYNCTITMSARGSEGTYYNSTISTLMAEYGTGNVYNSRITTLEGADNNGVFNLYNSYVETLDMQYSNWTGGVNAYNSHIASATGTGTVSGYLRLYNGSTVGSVSTDTARLVSAPNSLSALSLQTPYSGLRPLTIRGSSSQTADLFQWQDSAGTGLGVIDSSGNVGIGTTTPNHLLTVGKSGDATSTYALGVYGSIRATGSIDPNQSFDIAERWPIDHSCEIENSCPELGDVVSVNENQVIEKASIPYDQRLIGIVVGNSAITMGDLPTSTSRAVALAGRVKVKVSTKNGSIEVGDSLTSSSQPGVAMKATEPGRVIGIALESLTEADFENCGGENSLKIENCELKIGKVMVFINPHWSLGVLSDEGSLNPAENSSGLAENSILDQFTLAIKRALEKLGLLIENGIAKVKELIAEKVTTKEICLEGDDGEKICIDKNQLKNLLENQNPSFNSVSSGSGSGSGSDIGAGSDSGAGDGSGSGDASGSGADTGSDTGSDDGSGSGGDSSSISGSDSGDSSSSGSISGSGSVQTQEAESLKQDTGQQDTGQQDSGQ